VLPFKGRNKKKQLISDYFADKQLQMTGKGKKGATTRSADILALHLLGKRTKPEVMGLIG